MHVPARTAPAQHGGAFPRDPDVVVRGRAWVGAGVEEELRGGGGEGYVYGGGEGG